jgi:hypothetical protein
MHLLHLGWQVALLLMMGMHTMSIWMLKYSFRLARRSKDEL